MPASHHSNDPDSPNRGARALSTLAVAVVALPVLGILLGALYSAPAMRLARGRPRLLTSVLGICLAATTVALGCAFRTPWFWVLIQWPPLAAALLLRHRSYGTLDGNFERFGLVHYAAIGLGIWIGILGRLHVLPIVS